MAAPAVWHGANVLLLETDPTLNSFPKPKTACDVVTLIQGSHKGPNKDAHGRRSRLCSGN